MSWGEALAVRSNDLRWRSFRRLVKNVRDCCCALLPGNAGAMLCGNDWTPPSIVRCKRQVPTPLLLYDDNDFGNPPKSRVVVADEGENASLLFIETDIGATADDNCRRIFL